jgi:glycosyltransferase involved in cell wall biosynthesis
MKRQLSVIVITFNEEARIARALNSVKELADEIIVVDSGSTDQTVAICRTFTDKVFVTPDWPGFGPQKNRALAHATGEWVFSLDADEEVTPALAKAIRACLDTPRAHAYCLLRRSSYCGRFMAHSGWWPDPVCRLFLREKGRFTDDLIHERVEVEGPVHTLDAPGAELRHYSFDNLDQVLAKVNAYSTQGAQALKARGKKGSLRKAVAHGLWAFIRTYVLQRGFLDGREGFMLAVSNAEGTYYRYLKRAYLID